MERFRRQRGLFTASLAVSVIGLAACSSSGSATSTASSATGGATSSASGSSAALDTAPAPLTSPPTTMPISTPLQEKPPHESFIYLACDSPACQGVLAGSYQSAAKALGWSYSQITYSPSNPVPAVQQALNADPGFIAFGGIPADVIRPEIQQAEKQGTKLLSSFGNDPADPAKNDFYLEQAYPTGWATPIADWIIHDSAGKANAAITYESDYPGTVLAANTIQQVIKQDCPECKSATFNISATDISSGANVRDVVSYLQSHPSVNYFEFGWSALAEGGVETALKAAGLLGRVKFVGAGTDPYTLQQVSEGNYTAWTTQAYGYVGWEAMDAAARLAEGMPLAPYEIQGGIPGYVVTSASQAEALMKSPSGNWSGPAGFEQKFLRLWHIG